MRRALIIIVLTVLGAGAIGTYFVTRITSGVQAYHDTARSFLTSAIEGDATEAEALLHPQTATQWDAQRIRDAFNGAQPFIATRFPSISYNAENGISRTTIMGEGETLDGCISQLEFAFLNETITGFVVEPICGGGEISL